MKKIIFLVCVLMACITLQSVAQEIKEEGFQVKVALPHIKPNDLVISYQTGDDIRAIREYEIKDGLAIFTGSVERPVVAYLFTKSDPNTISVGNGYVIPGPPLEFVLSNDHISVTASSPEEFYMGQVSGGKLNEEWKSLMAKTVLLSKKSLAANKRIYLEQDSSAKDQRNEATMEIQRLQLDFVRNNPNSGLSPLLLDKFFTRLDFNELNTVFQAFSETNRTSSEGQKIRKHLQVLEVIQIGSLAPNFKKIDIDGNSFDLTQLTGSYVLLDFWGSWCKPCRDSHPKLNGLYQKYKKDGFEIVGIAEEYGKDLETATASWKKAIQEDNIHWKHILNNAGKDDFDVISTYGISLYPTKILIDKERKIIGKYGSDSTELEAKLKEIFGH